MKIIRPRKRGLHLKGYRIKEELEAKYNELQSMQKVADYYGVSKKLILNNMNRLGIPRREMGINIDIRKARNMLDKGYRLKDVAKELNISMTTARTKLQAKDIESDRFHKRYKVKDSGYVQILKHGHPRADKVGYVPEHTLVMEQIIGRYLKDNEVVHHINGDKSDNRPNNLRLMTAFQHKQMHSSMERKTVDIQLAAKMLDEGYTLQEVCDVVKVCKKTLTKKLKDHGLYKPLPKGTPAHKDQRKKTI
jgi:AraC-like DNA-binding protein